MKFCYLKDKYFCRSIFVFLIISLLIVATPSAVAATFNASCSSNSLTLSDRVVTNFPNDIANFTDVSAGTIFRVTNSFHSGVLIGNGIVVTHTGASANPVSINLNSNSGDPPSTADFTASSAGNIQFQINLSGSLAGGFARRQNWSISCLPPEIDVSSSEGGVIADGGTDAQGSEAAGTAKTVTYTVNNTGLVDLTLATATSSGLSNVTIGSISAPGSTTVAAGGGSTTYTVIYTPTVAGAYSFDLSFVNNDGDENPFNFTVSGTSTGAPEIKVFGNSIEIVDGDISPSLTDHTDYGPANVLGGNVTRTFLIANTGTDVLLLGANAASISGANAADFTVTTQPANTVAAGGSTLVTVTFDPSALASRFATLSIANDDNNESPYDFSISGLGIGSGSITIVQNISGPDIALGFTSPTPSLNFSLYTINGKAKAVIGNIVAGTYVVTAADLRSSGYGIASIVCDDNDSVGDINRRTATIKLAVNEHIICTYETIESRGHTSQMIADYLGARNTLLLAHQPDRERRLNKLKGDQGAVSTGHLSVFGLALNLPLPFNATISKDAFNFKASLQDIIHSGKKSRWDFWTEGHVALFNDDASQDGKFAVIYTGIDYLIRPNGLIGIMAQYDWLNQKYGRSALSGKLANTGTAKVSGVGWMVGPYTTWRLGDNFYFDTRAAWGQSFNKIKPFGTYEDKFDTERWLISTSLIGKFTLDNWSIKPGISFQYIEESQAAYTDSLRVKIPSQTLSQGDVRFGPRVGYTHQMANGSTLNPWLEFSGVYSFAQEGRFSNGSFANEIQGLTGTIKTGLNYITLNGIFLTLSGQYDGIGANTESYGGMLKINIPLD